MTLGSRNSFADKKNVKLLVLDENAEYFEQLKDCAEMCSHEFTVECFFSSDEKEAMKIIEKEHPSVILMDPYTPEVNGREFIEKCQEGVTSVVVTSENTVPEMDEVSREWGAEAYITKSENPDDVEQALRTIVDLAVPFYLVQ